MFASTHNVAARRVRARTRLLRTVLCARGRGRRVPPRGPRCDCVVCRIVCVRVCAHVRVHVSCCRRTRSPNSSSTVDPRCVNSMLLYCASDRFHLTCAPSCEHLRLWIARAHFQIVFALLPPPSIVSPRYAQDRRQTMYAYVFAFLHIDTCNSVDAQRCTR